MCVALSITFLTSPAPSTAQDGGRASALAALVDSQAVADAQISPASAPGVLADFAMYASEDGKLELAGQGDTHVRALPRVAISPTVANTQGRGDAERREALDDLRSRTANCARDGSRQSSLSW